MTVLFNHQLGTTAMGSMELTFLNIFIFEVMEALSLQVFLIPVEFLNMTLLQELNSLDSLDLSRFRAVSFN